MAAHQPHRLACRGADRRRAQPLGQSSDRALRGFAGLDHPGRHAERPRRGIDEKCAGSGFVMDEIALAEPVLDELVGGAGIRHPQQRFREHHQRQALLGGERKLPKHVLDAAEPVVVGPDGGDQPPRRGIDPRVLFAAQGAGFEKPGGHECVVRRVGRFEPRKGRGIGCHRMHFKFPCTIMPPVLASRNRCDSFRAIFLDRNAANGADAKLGTSR